MWTSDEKGKTVSHVQTGRCVIQRDRQRRQSHVPVAPKLSYRRVAQFPMKVRLTPQDTCSASDCDKSHKHEASCSTGGLVVLKEQAVQPFSTDHRGRGVRVSHRSSGSVPQFPGSSVPSASWSRLTTSPYRKSWRKFSLWR